MTQTEQAPPGFEDVPLPIPDDEPDAPQDSVPPIEKDDRDKAIRDSYGHAQKTLREKYEDEFNAARVAYLAERGIEWAPAPNETQKAFAQVQQLLNDHPDLARRLGITSATEKDEVDE